MSDSKAPSNESGYPLGRGYGHDYMRGGEVLGGYGYAEREDYSKRRGEDDAPGESEESADEELES